MTRSESKILFVNKCISFKLSSHFSLFLNEKHTYVLRKEVNKKFGTYSNLCHIIVEKKSEQNMKEQC